MQKIWLILLCWLLAVVSIYAESQNPSQESEQPSYTKLISPDKLKEDLDFLFKTIEEVHPNMYAYTSKEEFTEYQSQLYKQTIYSMHRLEFYKLVAPVVAQLKFGHTFISGLWEDFRDHCKNGGKVFPIELDFDGQQAFLTGNYGTSDLPMGGTVLSVNEEDVNSIIFKWAAYSPKERRNANPWLIKRHICLWTLLWLEYGNAKSLTLKIKSLDGKIADYLVPAIPAEQAKKTVRTKKGAWTRFSYREIPEYNTGLIVVNQFDPIPDFQKFLDETVKEIDNRKISNLIIDIRINPGGSSIAGDWLLKFLTDKPFAQFEGHIIQPEDKPFRFGGRIFALIGRLSASASVSFASAIKHSFIGTLVGEETGDATVNYGEARSFKLPNSGLNAVIATKHFTQAGSKSDGGGVIPDYEVKQKPEDTAKGVDTVLQFTLDLIRVEGEKEILPKSHEEGFEIKANIGLGPVTFGMSSEDVVNHLGKPEKVMNKGRSIMYSSKGFTLGINPDRGVQHVNCYTISAVPRYLSASDFKGKTKEGIGMGASSSEIVTAYGTPDSKSDTGRQKTLTYQKLGFHFILMDDKLVQLFVNAPPVPCKK